MPEAQQSRSSINNPSEKPASPKRRSKKKEVKNSSPTCPQLHADIKYYLQDAKLLHSTSCTCKTCWTQCPYPVPPTPCTQENTCFFMIGNFSTLYLQPGDSPSTGFYRYNSKHRGHQAGSQEFVASLCCRKPQIPYSVLVVCRLGDGVWAGFYWIWNTWNLRSLSHFGRVTAESMLLEQLWQVLVEWILQSNIGSQFLTSQNQNLDSNLVTSRACCHAYLSSWALKTAEQAELINERLL